MSGTTWLFILVLLLTLVGCLALLLVTVKYYWGERGTPPARGDERKRQKQDELLRRAAQIEYTKKHPREDRKPSFFDNRKHEPKARENGRTNCA